MNSHRGFVAVVGRPNVGKSTLVNALAGDKASIVSHRRQTTRGVVRVICRRDDAQWAVLDSPGWQTRHGGTLNKRLNAGAEWAAGVADVVIFMSAAPIWTDEDTAFLQRLPAEAKVVAAVNKVDLATDKGLLLPYVDALRERRDFAAIVPLCARRRRGMDALVTEVSLLLSESPALFDRNDVEDEAFFLAELLREKVFRALGDELPYCIGVIAHRTGKRGRAEVVMAEIFVERDSQKAIVIGAGGVTLKQLAAAARQDMERVLNAKVYLTVPAFLP
jgi:GTP-binding protein Era